MRASSSTLDGPPFQSNGKPLKELGGDIYATLGPNGIISEYASLGVEFHGGIRPNGKIECRGALRHDGDTTPSAYVDVNTGKYGDSGGDDCREIELWEFAARKKGTDWLTEKKALAERLGLLRNGNSTTKSPRRAPNATTLTATTTPQAAPRPAEDPETVLAFEDWTDGKRRLLHWWCVKHKKGIKPDAVLDNGGRIAKYRDDYVIALPIFGRDGCEAKPVGYVIWKMNGKGFFVGQDRPEAKMKTVGSADGIIGLRGWRLIALGAPLDLIIKTEGPTDLLAVCSILGDQADRVAVVSFAGGSKQANPWMAEIFRGQSVAVIHDADKTGETGAAKSCRLIATTAREVRHVRLPYPIEPKSGKDLRDWVVEVGECAGLLAMIEAAEPFDASTAPGPAADGEGAAADDDTFSNAKRKIGENGETIYEPAKLVEIIGRMKELTNDGIKRVGNSLFVDLGGGVVRWLSTPAAQFGYLQGRLGVVKWKGGNGGGFVTKEEFHAELSGTATAYDSVETLPHVPPRPTSYYACEVTKGDGAALDHLLRQLSPASDVDAQLLKALFVTLIWGGAGGLRPVFVLTSDAGRGAGKTTVAKFAGLIAGGLLDFSQSEKLPDIKTRLLSAGGVSSRVCLLDNVKSHKFSWAEFEGLVTAPVISGKKLYDGEGQRPNLLTWLVTLNGASLSKDLSQRCVIIKLAAPSRSASWEEDTTRFILDNRAAIVADLVAFYDITPEMPPRFTRWASWEKSVLSRLTDPEAAQRIIIERQGEADVERDECESIEDHFAERLADLNYNVDEEPVHIPNQIAAEWYAEATGDKPRGPTAVTRIVNQMNGEGSLKRLVVNSSRSHNRGLLWLSLNFGDEVRYDLADRIERRRLQKLEDEATARNRARFPT